MSRDDRDKAGGHTVRHPGLLDCLCCKTLNLREERLPRVTRKRLELQRRVVAEGENQTEKNSSYTEHAFAAGRCIRCGLDHIDAAVYPGLEVCEGKAEDTPISYSTSTGQTPVSSHKIHG